MNIEYSGIIPQLNEQGMPLPELSFLSPSHQLRCHLNPIDIYISIDVDDGMKNYIQ